MEGCCGLGCWEGKTHRRSTKKRDRLKSCRGFYVSKKIVIWGKSVAYPRYEFFFYINDVGRYLHMI